MKRLSMKIALVVLTLAVLVLLITPLIAQESDKDMVLTDILLQSLQQWHFSPQKINSQLPQRVFKLYLKSLDPNKQFLLKSDVAQLKNYQLRFDGQHKNGILDFYDLSIFMLQQRIEESNSLTQEILKQPFDFSINENYETNPEKKDYPSDVRELKKQWRLRLKYQTLLAYLDIINTTKEKSTSDQVTDQSPLISDQPFQPEIEGQARTKVAQNLKRSFERLLHKNDEDRFGDYLNAIAGSFDPHTEYFLPEQKDEFDANITGVMEGIGATLKEDGDYTTVVEIIPGSAAWKQKELQTDDTILKIAQGDGEPVDIATMPIHEVVKLIRGKKGTEVRLTVKKPNGRIVVIPIIRDVVVREEAYAKSAIISNQESGKKYGYIDLPSFYRDYKTNSRSCADDIRIELQKLNSEKVSGIILDLRNNGGGSLDDAVKMAGLFIKEGPIVQVKNNNGHNEVLRDPDPSIVYDGPLVVLVNSLSASASEILAAALQDYSRAIIVGGPKTFCKGTVQTVVDFDQLIPDSMSSIKPAGSLKLTIAKFYRINGGSTQGRGVIADIPLPDIYSYLGTGEKTLDYSLPWDTISAVSYQKWTSHLNISHLKQLSKERIQTSKVFKLISDNINLIQHEQKNSETLKFTSFIAEQKLLQKESEQLKNFSVGQLPYIKIVAPQSDSKDAQSSKMTDWLGQINKDAYIDEARHILDDMSIQ